MKKRILCCQTRMNRAANLAPCPPRDSAYAALIHAMKTGDWSRLMPAVWEETEERVKLARRVHLERPTESSAKLLGGLAGTCFAHREHYYDNPRLVRPTN